VNETEGDIIQITLIPYTIEKTTLADRKVGDPVNIETDILGKYVEKMLGDRGGEKGFDLNFLKEHGFIKEE
jgi:riboflavin synthase